MPRKKRRKMVVGDYIYDKTDRRPRGEEAVIKIIKIKEKRKILKKSYITSKKVQTTLIFAKKEMPKLPRLKKGDIVRISIKTQYGIGRIGKVDEVVNEKAYVKIIFRDGIFVIDFPFKYFAIEKANKKERGSYEILEERVYAKEVAEKL